MKKKRYVLELSSSYDSDNEQISKLAKRLNVCEKSFYPQSYLRMIGNKEEKNERAVHNVFFPTIRDDKKIPLYNCIDNSQIFPK